MSRDLPYAPDVEVALLGALLLDPQAIERVRTNLLPFDFYMPKHASLFAAMVDRFEAGEVGDPVSLASDPKVQQDVDELHQLIVDAGSVSSIPHYSEVLVQSAQRRRLIAVTSDTSEAAFAGGKTAAELRDELLARLDNDESLNRTVGDHDVSVDVRDFVDLVESDPLAGEWVIPNLLRRNWRLIVIGEEGVGKMVLLRQMAVMAAAGRYPLARALTLDGRPYEVPPVIPRRVMMLDVENPGTTINHQLSIAAPSINWREEVNDRLRIIHQPQGMFLTTNRRDRQNLEEALRKHRPDIVLAGPLYKLFRRPRNGDMEQDTLELFLLLDDLRTRYGFALVLEHHMPKGQAGSRQSDPFGSAVIMRWPEMGFAIRTNENSETSGEHPLEWFRGSREPANWPSSLMSARVQRQAGMAWTGRWKNGFHALPQDTLARYAPRAGRRS